MYATLLCAILEHAKAAKRVFLRADADPVNEKYRANSFLMRLGFGGPEHKPLRRVLLGHLNGYAAFRSAAGMQAHRESTRSCAGNSGRRRGHERVLDWIYEIALSRVDTIERELYAHPERSPKFSEAVRELHAALDETEEHPNAALTGRDEIWMGYTAALALEMYLAGARDGGRVHHAFVTGELPGREIQERKGEKWDDATDV